MSGNNRGIVLQERDRHLLRELAVMRVIDRELAKVVAGFGSTTRANARLLRLTRAGMLRRFFMGTEIGGTKAVYALSMKGAQKIAVPLRGPRRKQGEALVADFFVRHQLAVNDIYCAAKYANLPALAIHFHRWVAFREPVAPECRLIPDGYVEFDTPAGILSAFLEVDLGNESLTVWSEKVRKYLELAMSGEFERRFGQSRFRVIVTANSDRRLHSIRKMVAMKTQKVFWFANHEAIRQNGLFAPVWVRPLGGHPQRLMELPS